jgi:hypothetical protein
MDKIKDSVPAGIHSRDQVRPRHRALRRNAGRQAPERAPLGQSGEVWHLAFRHEFREQVRVEPVDAQDYQLAGGDGSPPRVLAGEKQA